MYQIYVKRDTYKGVTYKNCVYMCVHVQMHYTYISSYCPLKYTHEQRTMRKVLLSTVGHADW